MHLTPVSPTSPTRTRTACGALGLLGLLLLPLLGCRHPGPPPVPHFATVRGAGPFTNVVLESNVTGQLDPAWLQPSTNPFTLGPGDKLEIELIGEPLSRSACTVGPDGKLYFGLLPGQDVWGLTLAQARAQLEHELTRYVRQEPQVSLVLRGVESRRIWILGRVQAPGVYALPAPMTLLEAISMAGGTMSLASYRDQESAGIGEELADLPHSFVLRRGQLLPVDFQRLLMTGDPAQNIYLEPDDFVYFPAARAREIYVLGAVTQPRPMPYRAGLTVAGAIAGAYGTVNGAYLGHVAVVRGSLSQPQMAIVDYRRVIRGEALDIPLQPHDIVYVPFAPYRYLVRYAEVILNTFVSSAAINAGTRAVDSRSGGGAGVFIPVGGGTQGVPSVNPPPVP